MLVPAHQLPWMAQGVPAGHSLPAASRAVGRGLDFVNPAEQMTIMRKVRVAQLVHVKLLMGEESYRHRFRPFLGTLLAAENKVLCFRPVSEHL